MKLFACRVIVFLLLYFVFGYFNDIHAVSLVSTKSAELSVSARVSPRPSDFLFDLTSDLTDNTVGADTTIEYTITYGSKLDYWAPMVIEAEWSLGTVPEQSLYSYNIVSYVAGSATKDYWGESTPIVDTVNRKIRWVVKRFPPNTIGKTLKFKLKTPDRYVTDKNVNFTVRARMYQNDVYLPWDTLDQIYMPGEFIRKEVKGLQFLVLEIRRITDASFTLFLVTSVPAKATVYYGLSPDNLDKTWSDDTLTDQRLITIDGLLPATKYYYRVMIENEKGIQRKTPEVFEVTTSSTSLISLIDQERVLISSRGVLLKSSSGLGMGTHVTVPKGVPVEVFLPFATDVPSSVQLSLANQKVLGISTDTAPYTAEGKVRLLETQHRTYTGTITAPITRGLYDMVLETEGTKTGVNQDVMTTLVVSDPLTVVNEKGQSVERAIVYLERWNERESRFEYFPSESFGSKNPGWTESDGSTDFILPQGEYMVNVNAIGYKTFQKNFSFDPSGTTPYPRVVLERAPFSILTYITYYWTVSLDVWRFANYSVDRLASSWRFLDLSLLTSLAILSILSIFTNLRRVKLSLEGFLIFIEKWALKLLGKLRTHTLFIGFTEHSGTELPVHGVTVLLVDRKSKTVIGHDITNSLGEFHLRIDPGREYEIILKKHGFITHKESINAEALLVDRTPFVLTPEVTVHLPLVLEFAGTMVRIIFHAFSDTFLFAVGILNILLYMRLGIRVLPVFILTALNTLLWLEFHWHIFRIRRK